MWEVFRRNRSVSWIGINLTDSVQIGTIEYSCPFSRSSMSTSEAIRQIPIPLNGVLDFLHVMQDGAQLVAPQVVTVRINGADSILTISIPAAAPAGTITDLLNTVIVQQGDLISISFDSPAGSTAALIRAVSMRFITSG